jgi:hypothetical protein
VKDDWFERVTAATTEACPAYRIGITVIVLTPLRTERMGLAGVPFGTTSRLCAGL